MVFHALGESNGRALGCGLLRREGKHEAWSARETSALLVVRIVIHGRADLARVGAALGVDVANRVIARPVPGVARRGVNEVAGCDLVLLRRTAELERRGEDDTVIGVVEDSFDCETSSTFIRTQTRSRQALTRGTISGHSGVVDRKRVRKVVGKDGYAVVKRQHHALRVLDDELVQEAVGVRLYVREAQALREVDDRRLPAPSLDRAGDVERVRGLDSDLDVAVSAVDARGRGGGVSGCRVGEHLAGGGLAGAICDDLEVAGQVPVAIDAMGWLIAGDIYTEV
jgi:hypothetical protein